MRESSKAALGGIIAALSIVIMLVTYVSPLLVYTAPPFAGLLLIVIVYEMGYGWAFGTYAAVSLLSVFMIADKEAALFFTMFFGYYPLLREWMHKKIKNSALCYLPEILIFNVMTIGAGLIGAFFFNVDYSELTEGGRAFLILFWVLMNVVFFVYDFLVDRLVKLYVNKIQKRIRGLFRN